MREIAMKAAACLIRGMYVPFKALPTKHKVAIYSRQADEPSDDIKKVTAYINERYPDAEVVILSKKIKRGLISYIAYGCHILRQMYHMATAEALLLDGYCIAASIVRHKKDIRIIQMWHACCAVKKFGWQTVGKRSGTDAETARIMRMHRNYDYVLAQSKATAAHYIRAFDVDDGSIRYIALPHMEELLADGSSVKERMITHYPQLSYKVNIVYIPTFREGEKADLDVFEKNIDFTRFNFIARVHPKSEVIHSGSNVLEANLFSTYDWMHLADIIVTDYSSLALEAAVMSKKLYFYLYDFDKYSLDPGLNINIFEESIGRYAFTDIKDFDKLLREEYDYTALREFRDKYVEVDIRKGTEELTALLLEKR